MRLSAEQVKQAILHPDDKQVRFAALRYFSESRVSDPSVMPVAIAAIERFGRADAFSYPFPIVELTQTPQTIDWAVRELNKSGNSDAEQEFCGHLSRLLCRADPRLLAGREAEIVGSPGFSRLGASLFEFRMQLSSWDTETCWRELERICEEGRGKTYAGDFPYARAEQVVEELGRRGEEQARRMWPLLNQKVEDYENNPMAWMEPLMVQLAGELRYEPAVPVVVEKLHEDAEVLSEACVEALTTIGTDAVVETVRQAFPEAQWHFRLYGSGVLGHIHSDRAVEAGIDLLAQEQDADIQNWLAQSLVEQLSYKGSEAARRVLLDDPDRYDLMRALVAACTLMGQDFPELNEWRAAIAERRRSRLRRTASPPPAVAVQSRGHGRVYDRSPVAPPIQAERKVGRNDPCPCGSGKKYKKCCMTAAD